RRHRPRRNEGGPLLILQGRQRFGEGLRRALQRQADAIGAFALATVLRLCPRPRRRRGQFGHAELRPFQGERRGRSALGGALRNGLIDAPRFLSATPPWGILG